MGVWRDWLQQGVLVCCAWFVFLAGHASMDVVFCKFLHFSAFVSLAKEVCHVGDAGVSSEWVVVVQLKYFMPLFKIFGELDLGKACWG